MQQNEFQIEEMVQTDLHDPETALRRWIRNYQRLQQQTSIHELQIRELDMELEAMRDLVKVTATMLEKELGRDVDLEVMRHLASEWNKGASQELH